MDIRKLTYLKINLCNRTVLKKYRKKAIKILKIIKRLLIKKYKVENFGGFTNFYILRTVYFLK